MVGAVSTVAPDRTPEMELRMSVAAPSWFLPVAAACTGLLPACMIPVVKGMER